MSTIAGQTDPRITAAGGVPRRGDPRNAYDYPGMVDAANWRRTPAHRATIAYGCAWCGQTFAGPHAVYTHIAKAHTSRVQRGGLSLLGPPGAIQTARPAASLPSTSRREMRPCTHSNHRGEA